MHSKTFTHTAARFIVSEAVASIEKIHSPVATSLEAFVDHICGGSLPRLCLLNAPQGG